MDALFEQHITQNEALAAEVLWQTVLEAFESANRERGVQLPLVFIVLPIAFHRRSAESLAGRTQPGALYKALAADRAFAVGLQSRMESMWKRTQRALSLSIAAKLIEVDSDAGLELIPRRKTAVIEHVSHDAKLIIASAKRVGQAFAEMTPVQLMTHLGVRF
jgi:hypothetical protein